MEGIDNINHILSYRSRSREAEHTQGEASHSDWNQAHVMDHMGAPAECGEI